MDDRRPRRRRLRLVLAVAVLAALAVALGALGGRAWLAERPIRAGLAGCMDVREAASRIDCMRDRATDLAKEEGDDEAVSELRRVASRRVPIECHLAMHLLGERAGTRIGADGLSDAWRDIELDARSTCDQGWLHGFVSTVFEGVSDTDLERVLEDCTEIVDRPGECDHAIGHAFVRAHERRDAADALVRCQRLGLEGDGERSSRVRVHDCQHGAVMEDALLDAATDDPVVDECDDVTDTLARRNCYEFLVARAVLLGDDWDEAARRCTLPDERDEQACDDGFIAAAPDDATCRRHPDPDVRRTCTEQRPDRGI